jgi:hypothetical protein
MSDRRYIYNSTSYFGTNLAINDEYIAFSGDYGYKLYFFYRYNKCGSIYIKVKDY